jgi:hypothetical protein
MKLIKTKKTSAPILKLSKMGKTFVPYHEIGDILYGAEYLRVVDIAELKKKKFVYYSRRQIIEIEGMESFIYHCPFIRGNKYLWFWPTYSFADESKKREPEFHVQKPFRQDVMKAIKSVENPYGTKKDTGWENFGSEFYYMGHGYTEMTLPSDGCNHKELACVITDNGDILVGRTWVWFNK